MATTPEERPGSKKADKVYDYVRWLGSLHTIEQIIREFLGQ
jgi:hypothetical protein